MHQLGQQQRTPAALAVRPLARSMLVPRSSPLSPGGIAGAVIGSVIGALLIAFCVFPFIVRARRRRLARHDDPGQAEMGQGPGGPIFAPQDVDDNSYKRSSGSAADTGTVHHPPQTTAPDHKPLSTLPHGVTVEHGLPSPVSSPTSPTDPSSPPADGRTAPSVTGSSPAPSPTYPPSQSHRGSKGTADRENTREFSASDSYSSPSRQLTGIASIGITEEPESFDQPSGSPETGHFSSVKGSLRSLLHGRRSTHQRRDSKRSIHADTDAARSPSVTTSDVFPQGNRTNSGLEIDTHTPGLAWDYYNDPALAVDFAETYPQYTSSPTSAGFCPPALGPTSAPAGPYFPAGQSAQLGSASALTTRPVTDQPAAIASHSQFSDQPPFALNQTYQGSIQRSDTLPIPEIVSDIQNPSSAEYSIGPSCNPMDLMPPTNWTESAWKTEQEILMMQNPTPAIMSAPEPVPSMTITIPTADRLGAISPPLEAVSPTCVPADDNLNAMVEIDVKPQAEQQYPSYETPYQSPPMSAMEPGNPIYEETLQYYNGSKLFNNSDYSTPPPSTGPSTENTPDTRLTPFTASPSPPAHTEHTINGHLAVSPGPSSSDGLSPSPGLSPDPSRGRSPNPSVGRSQGRSPARPDGGFVCETCGAVKNSFHQFNHHKRYHERPWPCTFAGCELSFGTVTHLKRHINDKHKKTRSFYCTQPGCDYSRQGTKSFPRKDNWKRHMLKKHSIDPKNTDEDHLDDDAMDVA